jgi:hypothetical protein
VRHYQEQYSRTKDPLYAWKAYLECRVAKLELPEWVLSYLDRPAKRFWRLTHSEGPPAKPLVAIAEALEMKPPTTPGNKGRSGRRNIFRDHRDTQYAALAGKVALRINRGDGPLKAIIFDVAKESNVSKSTVERAWGEYRDDALI